MRNQKRLAGSIFKSLPVSLFLVSCAPLSQGTANPAAPNPKTKTERYNKSTVATKLDAAVTRILKRHFKADGPGVAVLVAENGVVKLQKYLGLANIARKQPITGQSVFDLASLSKQFTATAALSLISERKLSTHDEVAKLLPEFRVPVKGRAVTVGDLIYHVSGLADYTEDYEGSTAEFQRLTTQAHLQWLNETEPRRVPSRKWEYNNSGYVILASIIERKSGMPFAQFLQKRLFAPAGMKHTIVHDRLDLHRSVPHLVTGYKREKSRVSKSALWTQTVGDGNVLTTIEDMARWDRALRGGTILTNKQKKLAWLTGRLDNGRKISDEGSGYSFGWCTDEATGALFHSGSWMGTATYMVRNLDSGLTIILLSNDENADVGEIGNEIESILAD